MGAAVEATVAEVSPPGLVAGGWPVGAGRCRSAAACEMGEPGG